MDMHPSNFLLDIKKGKLFRRENRLAIKNTWLCLAVRIDNSLLGPEAAGI
jgi:hypothetical protein